MMHSPVAAELWAELRRFVGGADRAEAAEILVSVLINNDEDPEDIRTAFKGDSDIRQALQEYLDSDNDDPDEDEDLDGYLDDVDDPDY
jgi:hypothetical protein